MATAVKVPEAAARSLLKQVDMKVSKDAAEGEIVKKLKALVKKDDDDEEELDINDKSRKLLDKISNAFEEKLKVKIVSADADDDEDEEEEETPKKKGKGKKAAKASENGKAAKKKGGKKGSGSGKSRGGGGPTTKDKVFELWLKDPKSAAKKAIAKFGSEGSEAAQDTTIRRWTSEWKRAESYDTADGFPRIAKGRAKEIKAAQKKARSKKDED